MLLFIRIVIVVQPLIWNFNTSHVTVYRHSRCEKYKSFRDFNTSHVTVYPSTSRTFSGVSFISIHLMLLFIYMLIRFKGIKHYFNTSHVTVYRLVKVWKVLANSISIHLMLLFICNCRIPICSNSIFQYISCYCLSPGI